MLADVSKVFIYTDWIRQMRQKLFCLFSILTLAVVIGFTQSAQAGDCGFVSNRTILVQNHGHHVVTPVIAPVAIPLYGAGYNPGYGQQQGGDPDTNALLKQLLEEMKAMRAELAKQPDATASSAGDVEAKATLALLQKSCMSCHTEGSEKGDLAMFSKEGDAFKLSGAAKREIIRRVTSGSMPPKPAVLSAAEKAAIKKAYQ